MYCPYYKSLNGNPTVYSNCRKCLKRGLCEELIISVHMYKINILVDEINTLSDTVMKEYNDENWSAVLENLNKNPEKKEKVFLASELKLVYSCLDLRPKSFNEFVNETGFSPEKISNFLLELEFMGLIEETGRHYYVKKKSI